MQKYNFESSKAFITTCDIGPNQTGPLDVLTFGVKDNIDLASFKTSYGSKSWFDIHPPAVNHAICVEQLLGAGAKCMGKTIADEFTYSLDGESYFYGTPVNPKAPDRIPGGSSSGSASAVACGLVDFALGTDCAGSIRVPASLCGILGMRPHYTSYFRIWRITLLTQRKHSWHFCRKIICARKSFACITADSTSIVKPY
jgi:amidase